MAALSIMTHYIKYTYYMFMILFIARKLTNKKIFSLSFTALRIYKSQGLFNGAWRKRDTLQQN